MGSNGNQARSSRKIHIWIVLVFGSPIFLVNPPMLIGLLEKSLTMVSFFFFSLGIFFLFKHCFFSEKYNA